MIFGLFILLILALIFGFAAGTYAAYLGLLIVVVVEGYLFSGEPLERVVGGVMRGLIVGLLMARIGLIITITC